MTPKQINHLEWIYNRLVSKHGEKPDYDYMLEFKRIIEDAKKPIL